MDWETGKKSHEAEGENLEGLARMPRFAEFVRTRTVELQDYTEHEREFTNRPMQQMIKVDGETDSHVQIHESRLQRMAVRIAKSSRNSVTRSGKRRSRV